MNKEDIVKLVLDEIKKISSSDNQLSLDDSSLSPLLLLVEPKKELDKGLESMVRAANFNPTTDPSSFDDSAIIVLSSLSNKNLSYICEGADVGEVPSIIIEGLLLGKEIIIIEEGIDYRKYLNSSNKVFYEMLRNKEKALTTFGIKVIKKKSLASYLNKKVKHASCLSTGDVFRGKLMTEEHVKYFHQDGFTEVNVTSGVIITPLAKDYIQKNNISVVNRG